MACLLQPTVCSMHLETNKIIVPRPIDHGCTCYLKCLVYTGIYTYIPITYARIDGGCGAGYLEGRHWGKCSRLYIATYIHCPRAFQHMPKSPLRIHCCVHTRSYPKPQILVDICLVDGAWAHAQNSKHRQDIEQVLLTCCLSRSVRHCPRKQGLIRITQNRPRQVARWARWAAAARLVRQVRLTPGG